VILAAFALTLLGPLGVAAGQAQPVIPENQNRMRLDIDAVTPRVLGAASETVTVTGKVTNTGDRRIDDVQVQLQRGERLDSEAKLADARNQPTESARSSFVTVSAALEPGQSAPVTLTAPVRTGSTSLHIDQPGIYPVLVNVNGRPEYGGRARLATASLVLPVLAVPGNAPTAPPGGPTRVGMLWPLIDQPHQVPTTDGRLLLTDDDLATSLTPDGRLGGLVSAVEQVKTTDPAMLEAICFAVDPDLLQTVQLMTAGYRVRTPGGVVDGKGAEAAKEWLERVRALTAGQCVLPVPFADADLSALSRAGAVDLEKLAVTAETIAADVLKPAQPLTGVLWPAGGTLDQRTLFDLAATGTTTVLTDSAHVHNLSGAGPYGIGDTSAQNKVLAVPVDSLVSTLLADGGYAPGAGGAPSVQNGIAALTFRLAFSGRAAPAANPLLIAPPRRWAASPAELNLLLGTLRQLISAGLAAPQELGRAVSGTPRGTVNGLDYTAGDSGLELAPSIGSEVARVNATQRDFLAAMAMDDRDKVDPRTLVAPLQYGLLRATSTAWRGRPEQAGGAVDDVAAQLDGLRSQVTITNTGRPLTLASGNSPIPVLLSNAMPVSVVVRVRVADTPGLRPGPVADMIIPARGAINRYLPAEVARSGRFTVDVSLATPGGTALGSTTRLELTSTAYGSITLIITGTAAAALFLLVGLRIYRRVRAARRGEPETRVPAEGGAD
jgi:hypothetical protein